MRELDVVLEAMAQFNKDILDLALESIKANKVPKSYEAQLTTTPLTNTEEWLSFILFKSIRFIT